MAEPVLPQTQVIPMTIHTSTPTLARTEARLLRTAAEADGRLAFPATVKPAARERITSRLLRENLITPPDPRDGHHGLTPAAYRTLGLAPPATEGVAPLAPGGLGASKKAQVLGMLQRGEGATLAELTAATGWLPQTVRGALSRLRSAGQPIVRAAREGTEMAYRIPPAVTPPAARTRRTRTAAASKGAEVTPAASA